MLEDTILQVRQNPLPAYTTPPVHVDMDWGRDAFSCNHPKAPVLLNKKLASSSLASFFIIEGKHLLHLLLTSVVSQIV